MGGNGNNCRNFLQLLNDLKTKEMNNFDNKSTDTKQAEKKRRAELAMLDLLIDTYPAEARQKVRQKFDRKPPQAVEKALVFR